MFDTFNPLSTHNLPGERQSSDKTILVLSSSHEARVFILQDYDMAELPSLSSKKFDEKNKEKEGFSFISNEGSSQATNVGLRENKRMHYDPLFVKKVIDEIQTLDDQFQSARIVVHAPEGINTLYEEEFANKYTDKVVVHVGNHINTSFPDIFELIPHKLHPA